MKIVAAQTLDQDEVRRIVAAARVVHVTSQEELLREVADAEIVYGMSADALAAAIQASESLRWAHTSTAGVDRYIPALLTDRRVTLTCAKGGAAGRNLAEHALGLALALSRRIGEAARSTQWRRRELGRGAFELSERTAGIVGFGAAGVALAKLLSGFEMTVLAVKRTGPFSESERVRVVPADNFLSVCGESDVVFNFLPATSSTEKMFGRTAFETMKSSAFFVNVGRGATVDTDALVEALRNGSIAGAGIDTVDPEPLPDDHALWSMPNVVITPHTAGVSPDRSVRNVRDFLENLARYRDGEALRNTVDPNLGY